MDETPSSSQPILDTLRTVEFRLGLKGYNVDEVDEYLEKAAVEAEQVRDGLRSAVERARSTEERLRRATETIAELESERTRGSQAEPAQGTEAAPQASSDALQQTLELAQRFVEQTKRECEAEAAGVVARAEEQARQIATDAEKRLRDDVTRLEAQRVHLGAEVEAVGKHLEEQRAQLRTSLTEMLKWVDERFAPPSSRTRSETPPEARPEARTEGRERSSSVEEAPGGGPLSKPPGEVGSASVPQRSGQTSPERAQVSGRSQAPERTHAPERSAARERPQAPTTEPVGASSLFEGSQEPE
ncbi:MAG: DivIVA domain-containing protein [Acidimicrobiales bacterium]